MQQRKQLQWLVSVEQGDGGLQRPESGYQLIQRLELILIGLFSMIRQMVIAVIHDEAKRFQQRLEWDQTGCR